LRSPSVGTAPSRRSQATRSFSTITATSAATSGAAASRTDVTDSDVPFEQPMIGAPSGGHVKPAATRTAGAPYQSATVRTAIARSASIGPLSRATTCGPSWLITIAFASAAVDSVRTIRSTTPRTRCSASADATSIVSIASQPSNGSGLTVPSTLTPGSTMLAAIGAVARYGRARAWVSASSTDPEPAGPPLPSVAIHRSPPILLSGGQVTAARVAITTVMSRAAEIPTAT
jgi:hypothetical protein